MVRRKISARHVSRRQALRACLAPIGVVAAGWLAGCGSPRERSGPNSAEDDDGDADRTPAGADAGGSTTGRDGGTAASNGRDAASTSSSDARAGSTPSETGTVEPVEDAGSATSADASSTARADAAASGSDGGSANGSSTPDASGSDVPWASGGTKVMAGNYPDPFAGGMMGAACMLYPAQTLGPCYSSPVMAREDISDGIAGLPLRLSFLVVRSDGCTPVANAEVDIWHTGSNGVYSAFASGICNPNRADVASERFCRGKQSTNESGRVDFSTVFPGWYSGRTIHIHFTVRVGGREYITSQLYFEDALCDEIMQQADYKARGRRDTTNRDDSILRSANIQPFLFASAKRPDGALHAWKVLSGRS